MSTLNNQHTKFLKTISFHNPVQVGSNQLSQGSANWLQKPINTIAVSELHIKTHRFSPKNCTVI